MTTIAVPDLDCARTFYEDVLGVPRRGDDTLDGVLYEAGGVTFLVYPSAQAGTNRATYESPSRRVAEAAFGAEVAALRDNGLAFDTFEMDGITWDDGVASWEGGRAVWFTDPDGNILALETV